MIAESCYGCQTGLHHECINPVAIFEFPGDPADNPFADEPEPGWVTCCCSLKPQVVEELRGEGERNPVGRPTLDPSEVTDARSTGRKRASQLYPIYPNTVCEWAWLRNAGGGIEPIVGCEGNIIQPTKGPDKGDRHHGPDKNTLNNSPGTLGGNLHRICATCHNRWHAKNNRYYSPERPPADMPYLPLEEHGTWREHDPSTKATPEEIEESEAFWGRNAKTLLRGVDTSD